MTSVLKRTEVNQTKALEWLRYSLCQGDVISPAALKYINEHPGHVYTLAPEGVDPTQLEDFESGAIGTGPSAALTALATVLTMLAELGSACVVVEDELRSKGDPKPDLDGLLLTGFVDEKVIHWASLSDGAEAALTSLSRGSHGYPTNAFVTLVAAEELGLVDGADLDHYVASAIVASLAAVIVAAYDADSFLIWEPVSQGAPGAERS
jgi:hypothetical protein